MSHIQRRVRGLNKYYANKFYKIEHVSCQISDKGKGFLFDWVGPLEIDFVRDKNSLEFYIIDVNPRFPSWIYLAAKAGQNLPLAAVHLALGERVDRFSEYETGLMFVRSAEDLVFDIETFTKFMAEEEDSNELYRRV